MSSSPTPYIKLICLNIEKEKHLDRILPFLKKEKPDIVALQEVLEKDIGLLENSLAMNSIFTPLTRVTLHNHSQVSGQAVLTKLPFTEIHEEYYRGNKDSLPFIELIPGASEEIARALNIVKLGKDGKHYCLANTHFTWAPNGGTSSKQSQDLESLFRILSFYPDVILCGDLQLVVDGLFTTPHYQVTSIKLVDNVSDHLAIVATVECRV